MEERILFSRDEGAFVSAGSLTFSFPEDGTPVGAQVNNLGTGLETLAPSESVREAMAIAMQTWLREANVNFGWVEDSNEAIGVYGPTRGDARFGDVRITGFDFSTDTFAEAVSQNTKAVGTWAGEVFFNTAAAWPSLNALQSAALHEFGHVLGLEHSDDVESVMHTHGGGGRTTLAASDIATLQSMHGERAADPNEENHGNDTIDRATRIRGADEDESSADGFDGSQVWIHFGDLLDENDRDVFEIKVGSGYAGPLAIEVRTAGLSLARLRAEVSDEDGNVLGTGTIDDVLGGSLLLQVQNATKDSYFVHVFAADDPFWAQGDFSVTVATPDRLADDGAEIAAWSRDAHRWYFDSDGAERGFSYQLVPSSDDQPDLDDDKGSDDDISGSRDLTPILATSTRVVYRSIGTLSSLADLDHYRVEAPESLTGDMDMVVSLESLQRNGLIPEVRVLDEQGNVLDAEVRVRGQGLTQLVVSNATAGDRYVIQLKRLASADASYQLGNFSLGIEFGAPGELPMEMILGTLSETEPVIEREWYVARPQLFSLSLSSEGDFGDASGQVWVSVLNEAKDLVTALIVPLGELRTLPGVLLDPGVYYLQVTGAVEGVVLPTIPIRLTGEIVTDPIGPVLGSTGVAPKYLCPGQTAQYCYPNSPNPTTVTTSVSNNAPTTQLPARSTTPAPAAADAWFWLSDFRPTNPTEPLDTSGDGLIGPLDALVVINRLNDVGSTPFPTPPIFVGYLDASQDGDITPLDALIVINYLNAGR